ncbi:hypothetical protein B0H14DRAFT_3170520 [Mycena olivaceomarginata]|nr:hypothetical protein B0H14DRAFT_3170520 [Mycena olivaceomarginata]
MSVIRTALFFPPTVTPLPAASYCPYSSSWMALSNIESNPTIQTRGKMLWNSNIQADIVARLNRNTGHASISPRKAMFPIYGVTQTRCLSYNQTRPSPSIEIPNIPAAERIPGLTSQSQHHTDNIGFWVPLCVAKISSSSVVASPSFYGDKKRRAF